MVFNVGKYMSPMDLSWVSCLCFLHGKYPRPSKSREDPSRVMGTHFFSPANARGPTFEMYTFPVGRGYQGEMD